MLGIGLYWVLHCTVLGIALHCAGYCTALCCLAECCCEWFPGNLIPVHFSPLGGGLPPLNITSDDGDHKDEGEHGGDEEDGVDGEDDEDDILHLKGRRRQQMVGDVRIRGRERELLGQTFHHKIIKKSS